MLILRKVRTKVYFSNVKLPYSYLHSSLHCLLQLLLDLAEEDTSFSSLEAAPKHILWCSSLVGILQRTFVFCLFLNQSTNPLGILSLCNPKWDSSSRGQNETRELIWQSPLKRVAHLTRVLGTCLWHHVQKKVSIPFPWMFLYVFVLLYFIINRFGHMENSGR